MNTNIRLRMALTPAGPGKTFCDAEILEYNDEKVLLVVGTNEIFEGYDLPELLSIFTYDRYLFPSLHPPWKSMSLILNSCFVRYYFYSHLRCSIFLQHYLLSNQLSSILLSNYYLHYSSNYYYLNS